VPLQGLLSRLEGIIPTRVAIPEVRDKTCDGGFAGDIAHNVSFLADRGVMIFFI